MPISQEHVPPMQNCTPCQAVWGPDSEPGPPRSPLQEEPVGLHIPPHIARHIFIQMPPDRPCIQSVTPTRIAKKCNSFILYQSVRSGITLRAFLADSPYTTCNPECHTGIRARLSRCVRSISGRHHTLCGLLRTAGRRARTVDSITRIHNIRYKREYFCI